MHTDPSFACVHICFCAQRNLMGTGSYHLHNIDKLIALVSDLELSTSCVSFARPNRRMGLSLIIACLLVSADG